MTDPAEITPGTPTITLGGREWPIPELVWRQMRVVRRPLIDITDAISAATPEESGEMILRLPTALYEQVGEVVYQGLTRAHPKLTRDEFETMRFTNIELWDAFFVVRAQSGVFRLVQPGDAPEGEAAAAAATTQSPTGTE